MRLLALVAFSFIVGGCLDVDAIDGSLVCSTVPDRKCPMGFYCAPNNTCWRNGHGFYDMSIGGDLASPPFRPADLSGQDLSSPND
jgi:hypothetical protein